MTKTIDTKICKGCGKVFPRPLCSKGYPVYKSRWETMKFCSAGCSNKYRHGYLSTHVKETGTLHSGCGQAGSHQGERICDMQRSHEAETYPKVRALGSFGRVKGPLLHHERDRLFEKYLYAVDQYLHFISFSIGQPLARRHAMSLYRHIEDLNTQLQRYDERINAAQTTGPLLY